MRNNEWLKSRLEHIWQSYFSDINKTNEIQISFGKRAKTRLGSIRQSQNKIQNTSYITITGYFRDENVPEYVVDLVIAHELCHYAHGFCSPLPQLYKNPHQGKVIDKELYKRGFGEDVKRQKSWLKTEWPEIVKNNQSPRNKKQTKNKSPYSNIWRLIIGK